MKTDEKLIATFGRVCDFISSNLDENLKLEEISKLAGISKFHFHRLFSIHIGISFYSYIQLQRLKRASYQLVFVKDLKIIDIALNAGFESPESFSRAFKKTFDITPTKFRKSPDWELWHKKYDFKFLTGENKVNVKIENLPEILIAVLEYQGPPSKLNDAIPSFINWRKTTGLSPVNSSRTFGLVYCDPETTPPQEFRFDICGEIQSELPKNNMGIVQKVIPAGRFAVLQHTGSHDGLSEKIYSLYRDWLPNSKEEVRDFPLFFNYHNFFPETCEAELITDIYLPLK